MGILFLVFAFVAASGGASPIGSRPARAPFPKRPATAPFWKRPATLQPSPDEPDVTFEDLFEPKWLHSDGCRTFYWGFCVTELVEAYTQYAEEHGAGNQEAMNDAREFVEVLLYAIAPVGAVVAKWIENNICLRFDFKIRAYTTDYSMGNERLWSISGVLSGWQFEQWVPQEHPLEYLEDSADEAARGWKRVWMRRDYKPSSVSPDGLFEVIWPDYRQQEGELKLGYLANSSGIRQALTVGEWGLGKASDLTDPCGETKWMLTGRDNALKYFD